MEHMMIVRVRKLAQLGLPCPVTQHRCHKVLQSQTNRNARIFSGFLSENFSHELELLASVKCEDSDFGHVILHNFSTIHFRGSL